MSANSNNSLESPARTERVRNKGAPIGEAEAEEAPFTGEELRALSRDIPDCLPAEEEMETRIALVDIDPCHVHVYWHVQAADLEAARGAASSSKTDDSMLLRLHDAICTVMVGFIPWPPMELKVSGLNGYRYVEIPDCGKTLIAELGLRGPNGSFTRLASSHPVRLPPAGRAGNEIAEPVELVLIDEPGSPPRIVEVVPPKAEPPSGETVRASSRRLPATPAPRTFAASPGAASAGGFHGPMPSPLSSFSPIFASSNYHTEPWYWSGGPMPGFSGGEHD